MKPHKVETKLGNVWVTPTGARHLYVEFGHYLNVEQEGPEPMDRRGPITIRGIRYGGSMHLYLYKEGCWDIGEEGKSEHDKRHALYMTRCDKMLESASEAARKMVSAVVRQAVQDWAWDLGTAPILREAEIGRRRDQLDRMTNELEEVNEKRTKLIQDIHDEVQAIHALEGVDANKA